MQISARVHYGCLAMLELASRHDEDRPVALREIVAKHPIPQPFLVQILQSLRTAGLVISTRGSSGGYRLTREPREISILDIAVAIGCGDVNTMGDGSSSNGQQEAVRQLWVRAEDAAKEVLAQTSLSDMLAECGEHAAEMFYI